MKTPNTTPPDLVKTPPWEHQAIAFNMIKDLPGCMIAYDMGVGKSKCVVDAVVNLTDVSVTLIVCPKSVMQVWPREFEKHAFAMPRVVVLDKGTMDKRVLQAENEIKIAGVRRQKLVLVINYDSARMEKFASWALSRLWDLVVADESHRAKTHNSQTSIFMGKLGLLSNRRVCLTGTPMPHSPLDVFGQYRFLNPHIFGRYWTHFKQRYAIMGGFQRDGRPVQIVGIRYEDELNEKFYQIAHRVMKRDVLKDLPDVTHERVDIQLSPTAMKHYANLEKHFVTEIENEIVTVQHALTKLLRLQQCTSGFLVGDESEEPLSVHTAKEDALREIIEDLNKPLVVFCRFRHDLDTVHRCAKKVGRPSYELSGRTNELQAWQEEPGAEVLAVQIQAGGVGVDLTRASYCVYLSIGFSLGDYEQSLARLDRPGQKEPVTYFHLVAANTVDEKVYGALQKRKNVVESILSELRGEPAKQTNKQGRQLMKDSVGGT